ncbi:MAG: DUF4126 domain-containing protein [Myxococcota bacterium]
MAVGLTALVLAALCGIRTWFPLWLVAFAAWVGLADPSEAGGFVAQGGIVATLTVLWAAEIGADKVLGLDRRLQTFTVAIKPLVATFVAVVAWPDVPAAVAGTLGAVIGGMSAMGLAWAKAGLRRFATDRLPGIGNVLVSSGEDVFVVVTGILAVIAPMVALGWALLCIGAVALLVVLASSGLAVEHPDGQVADLRILMASQPPKTRAQLGIGAARHHL